MDRVISLVQFNLVDDEVDDWPKAFMRAEEHIFRRCLYDGDSP